MEDRCVKIRRHYLQVAETLDAKPTELPTAADGTLLLTTLDDKFPGVSGLQFRNEESGEMKIVHLAKGRFSPLQEDGWENLVYYCVMPKVDKNKKRKWDDDEDEKSECQKSKKGANEESSSSSRSRCSDLIVLSLSWNTTNEELKKYFKDFGDVALAKVNREAKTGKSKGFGFIRFTNLKSQTQVLRAKHLIGGRWCEVKIPNRTNFR